MSDQTPPQDGGLPLDQRLAILGSALMSISVSLQVAGEYYWLTAQQGTITDPQSFSAFIGQLEEKVKLLDQATINVCPARCPLTDEIYRQVHAERTKSAKPPSHEPSKN